MISDEVLLEILARHDVLMRHGPHCPACGSAQVQIMDKGIPAQWRCRICRTRFESEPTVVHPRVSGSEVWELGYAIL
jgi:ribosomal protein L37AE/L43A